MKKITFNDYKDAIKQHYEVAKKEDVSGILASPSPAQMRTLCLITCDRGISKKDEEVFRLFFETKENESLKKSIENCNTDKFKSVISFLQGKRNSENNIRIEVSAIILNYKPRPYSLFSSLNYKVEKKETPEIENPIGILHDPYNEKATDKQKENEDEKPSPIFLVINNESSQQKNELTTTNQTGEIKGRNWKKIAGIGLGSIAAISFGYTAKNMIFPEKECMKWCEDHYELVNCLNKKQSFASYEIVKPYDEIEFKRKKLKICDTTCFFKNNEAIVWYNKHDGQIHCYNIDGKDPVTGKELDQITPYMVNKYFASNE